MFWVASGAVQLWVVRSGSWLLAFVFFGGFLGDGCIEISIPLILLIHMGATLLTAAAQDLNDIHVTYGPASA